MSWKENEFKALKDRGDVRMGRFEDERMRMHGSPRLFREC